ncbi:methyl-accepting chemotaxis protein [Allohahella marinimesophila]|uniref:Methyl-accepting chemotaxis protein n=1 Tax=Allohahella marinimesophila TaxID=1054972 RepID=A0ABP7NHU4_9GAMM
MGLRWKLQIVFFAITMAITIYNRLVERSDLLSMLALAKAQGVSEQAMSVLNARFDEIMTSAIIGSGIEFIIQFALIALLANVLVRPLNGLLKSLKSVEKGDLTKSVDVTSEDEIGQLQVQFNSMLDRLNGLFSSIDDSSLHMGQSAYQIAAVSQEIETITKTQEARSTEVSEATRMLFEASEQVRDLSGNTLEKALQTEARGAEGVKSVQGTIDRMRIIGDGISNASSEVNDLKVAVATIGQIVAAIRSISEQTNLLALNAAIEAARAGESGRGFAVVADEVRALAGRAGHSAEEVSRIVGDLTERVGSVAQVMDGVVADMETNRESSQRTIHIIEAMGTDLSETTGLNQRISQASTVQLNGLEQVNGTLAALFEMLQDNARKIGNTANIGEALFTLNTRLQNQLTGMKYRKPEESQKKTASSEERRTNGRVPGHLLVTVNAGGHRFEGLTQDISMTGIKLLIKNRFEKGQKVEMQIRLPSKDVNDFSHQASCTISGHIVWRKDESGRFQYGIHFVDQAASEQAKLAQCVGFFDSARGAA